MDTLATLESMGLTLPSPAYIFGALVFGLVGLVAWRQGRRTDNPVRKWIGIALMFYPYAVSSTALLYGLGVALCAAAWFSRG
jgi:hypothetical protein